MNFIVWLALLGVKPKSYVEVSFLNVGQGDAILIEAKNHNQILIDGGSNQAVLKELSKELPWFDRSIDVIIATHPDKDHIGGLPEIIERYQTNIFIESGVEADTAVYEELKRRVSEVNIRNILARRGMRVHLGDGSYLEILFPDRNVSGLDTNDASIVSKYVYGGTCFLLTGDTTNKIEEYLTEVSNTEISCQVLKVAHHGSKSSSDPNFLLAAAPSYAVISAGKNNPYGHPHKEVLDNLSRVSAQILSTAEMGTIRVISDGKNTFVK